MSSSSTYTNKEHDKKRDRKGRKTTKNNNLNKKNKLKLLQLDRTRPITNENFENDYHNRPIQQPSYAVSITLEMIENASDNELLNANNNNNNNNNKTSLNTLTHLNLRYVPMQIKNRNSSKTSQIPIGKINAMENVPNLRFLDLSGNIICKMENLHALHHLRILNLAENKIKKLEHFDTLTSLERLNMTGNCIEHIPSGIQKLRYLMSFRIERNQIKNIGEIIHLNQLHNLVTFTFRGNPCADSPHSTLFVIYQLKHLDMLDGNNVSLMNKKKARETFEDEQVQTLSYKLKIEKEKASRMEESVKMARKEITDVKNFARKTLQDLSNRESMLGKELDAKNALPKTT